MNRQVRRVSTAVVLMFVALFASTTLNQVVRAESLYQDPRNVRASYESYKTQRGPILVGDRQVVESLSVDNNFRFLRVYKDPKYAAVTGFFSVFTGSTGVERAMNSYLSGQSSSQFFEQINALLDGTPVTGAAVVLTIDPVIQGVAWDALGDRKGAVVALDPRTGRILAMVSKPSFDPNLLAVQNFAEVQSNYQALLADPDNPLFNRAIGGNLYHPGSVFKLVVAAAALESGRYTASSPLPNVEGYRLPGTVVTIRNSGGALCGSGATVSLGTALAKSCNVPFAQLGVALGQDRIRAQAELMGFGDELRIPNPVTASIYPSRMDDAQTALSAFGQFDVRTTPLQMAMVSSAIANRGVLMYPQLIDSVVANNLNLLSQPNPRVYSSPISDTTAAFITRMMMDSVENGAATRARISGVNVAGKTGTAEAGPDDPYVLWFTGFAPAENPQVVVAVVIEDGGGLGQSGSGNQLAAPIAKRVIEAVLNR
jgi:peptidoglycan glycosyltransferase